MNITEARKLYNDLSAPPLDAGKKWFQARGRDLELIVKALLKNEKLEPHIRFRPDGEEIDGSFVCFSRTYLLELKWHSKPIEASAVYSFKGKVDGKLIGTIGVFISMSGYSNKAVDAISKGKEMNVILFDKEDLDVSFKAAFLNVLKSKLRAASEEGNIYFKTDSSQISLPTKNARPAVTSIITSRPIAYNTICFICEGYSDQVIIQELIIKTIAKFLSKLKVRIAIAGGQYNLIKTAKSLNLEQNTNVFIVSDGDNQNALAELKRQNDRDYELIVINPDIERAWLSTTKEEIRSSMREFSRSAYFSEISKRLSSVNIDELAKTSKSYEIIYEAIKNSERYT